MSFGYTKSVSILNRARLTIRSWPTEVRRELGAVLMRLQKNEYVGMPDMRAMPSIHKGVFEIRIKSKDNFFRTFHLISKRT
jgi:phage-related protein